MEEVTKFLFFISSPKINNSYNAEFSNISVIDEEKIFFKSLAFS